MKKPLKAPFPYFGGKSRVADLAWSRLGNPDNYVEPFAGSLAVLLRRSLTGKIETVNDRNHYIVNFWRAVQSAPEQVTEFADHPVTEADLHARHEWLVNGPVSADFRSRIVADPLYYDARFAGWWVWGQCCWIGAGWCDDHGETASGGRKQSLPCIDGSRVGRGIQQSTSGPVLRSDAETRGVLSLGQTQKVPLLNADFNQAGTGVHGNVPHGRPQLGDAYDIGRGVNSNGAVGTCDERREWLSKWIHRLADRIRLVRVCYGDWHRVCNSKTTMDRLGITGAFLDPPYAKNVDRVQALLRGEDAGKSKSSNRANVLYAGDKDQDIDQLVVEVNKWCQQWGKKTRVRIALCGYEGEHNNLVDEHGWSVVEWKAHGGYANRNAANENKTRERIWLSPACLADEQGRLF